MTLKESLLVGGAVIGLAFGAHQALAPATPEEFSKNRKEQMLEDLADADEASKQRMRESGNDHLDAENDRKLRPGETRPPERRVPKIRIRLP